MLLCPELPRPKLNRIFGGKQICKWHQISKFITSNAVVCRHYPPRQQVWPEKHLKKASCVPRLLILISHSSQGSASIDIGWKYNYTLCFLVCWSLDLCRPNWYAIFMLYLLSVMILKYLKDIWQWFYFIYSFIGECVCGWSVSIIELSYSNYIVKVYLCYWISGCNGLRKCLCIYKACLLKQRLRHKIIAGCFWFDLITPKEKYTDTYTLLEMNSSHPP